MQVQSPVKRVAAIHDISGYGRTSLSVVIPILSTMGIKVCSLPTALLSSHSQYDGYHFVDLTDNMSAIIEHWKKLGASFDVIYSGFLGSHKQICIVEDMINEFKTENGFVVIDPVLGDNGKQYSSISNQIVVEMRSLIKKADIITPNLTELFLLLGQDYNIKTEETEIKDMMLKLADAGPEIVVVTSAPDHNPGRQFSVLAYNKNGNRFWKVPIDYIPADFPGTGDCFTSVLTGALMQGDSLPIALDRAVSFISYGVRATFGYKHDAKEGILLEKILDRLNTPMPISSYEVF
ncbi:MAG: pyridoxamine kinase [Bacteroidales bacterium]|nr:pyridoxamine kinase [Bacteroidales bacterium]MDD4217803.1 pyridoxamine kinase [Bacteroidales bacterium]MDY0143460.1 pyridoxamine kinase [Bacteroidales bacterium]